MNGRHKNSISKKIFKFAVMIPLAVILAFGAIKAGILAGNLLFNMDTGFISTIDSDNLKSALNYSFPLMDTVYNSGDIEVSIIKDIQELIGNIFSFELGTPATILGAQSPYLSSYYRNEYIPRLAEKMKEVADKEASKEDPPVTVVENTPETQPNTTIPQTTAQPPAVNPEQKPVEEQTKQPDTSTGLKEDMSSWFYEGESDDKTPGTNIISEGKIQIQNESGLKLDIQKLMKESLNIKFQKKGPRVLIYHTHTTESYMPKLSAKGVSSWNSDPRYNVVKVGDELTSNLKKKYGISVLHNGTVHNVPDQNKAYIASLETLTSYLKSYPSLQITIDLHRDASASNEKLRLPVKVNNKNAAQIMFVVGTKHENWKENLKLAMKLQEKANQLYPGLAKPIWIAKDKRYNQHMRNGSITIEVGGDGNTLDEALESSRCLARIIGEVMKEIK